MQISELKQILESTGLPVAYRFFPEGKAPVLPFLVYYQTGARNFAADGLNYHTINNITVELYTKVKNPILEEMVEGALQFAIWDKDEIYNDAEKCYEIVYTMEV